MGLRRYKLFAISVLLAAALGAGCVAAAGAVAPRVNSRPQLSGARVSRCTASKLTPQDLGGQGLTGNQLVNLELKNTGSTRCYVKGWAKIAFVSKRGAVLNRKVQYVVKDLIGGGGAPRKVLLAPGHAATFRVIAATELGDTGASDCRKPWTLRITAPHATTSKSIRAGDFRPCGAATVSPLRLGSGH